MGVKVRGAGLSSATRPQESLKVRKGSSQKRWARSKKPEC